MPGPQGVVMVSMAVLAVDGADVGVVHRSVLDRVAEIAERLGCDSAAALGTLPASCAGDCAPRLRRNLNEIIAFADAARRTGWVLGSIEVAPGEEPVPVLDTPQGRLWAYPASGFELHGDTGVRRVSEFADLHAEMSGTARRAALTRLMAPLVEAAAGAGDLVVYERDG